MNKEYKTVVNTNFVVLMYEVEEFMTYGWRVSQELVPTANIMGLYEVALERDDACIERVRKNIGTSVVGKMDYTKEMKQATLASARTKRFKKEESDNEG
jgi:hypothetical protein